MELFEEGQWVDVIGTSKGKGFQGVDEAFSTSTVSPSRTVT